MNKWRARSGSGRPPSSGSESRADVDNPATDDDRLDAGKSGTVRAACSAADFIALEASARLVLTDSSGVQEETTVLGVLCLTLRDNTERPVTITEGTKPTDRQAPGPDRRRGARGGRGSARTQSVGAVGRAGGPAHSGHRACRGSASCWERTYASGDTSGLGSSGVLA